MVRFIKWIVIVILGGLVFLLAHCQRNDSNIQGRLTTAEDFLNIEGDVKYVGMQVCRSCHLDIYETYIQTGMGRSFDHATQQKSAANFGEHTIVYDEALDFYYRPYWEDSALYIMEFRLTDGDTTHKRVEKISYIIGSGQHTNSHLIETNGYVYQAPITFYTQEGRWDMAPGFEDGANSRFSRIIATECMTCHNHLPEHVEGSENKYVSVPRGIECERCHGPGELHAREMLAGNTVDTSKYIDYTIVTPTHLPVDLEIDICQRCHLQGTAVLKEGKSFFDYRPGMPLNEVMNVFLPRYTNAHERFIMASQADRMRLSDCFKIGKMSCTTCHNPHHSVEATVIDDYNNACISCHGNVRETACELPPSERLAVDDNCIECHMPKSGSIDIPHVRITDHFITRPVSKEEQTELARFVGLACLTSENPTPLEMAQGYIALYEKFIPEAMMLDSAKLYLGQSNQPFEAQFNTLVHYAFTRAAYQDVVNYAKRSSLASTDDAWTLYRIGESYAKTGDKYEAVRYFRKAVERRPYNLDFNLKLGTAYLEVRDAVKAKEVFTFIVSEHPKQPRALNNLGFIALLQGDDKTAENYYNQALTLNPDYDRALLNKAGLYIFRKDYQTAKHWLKEVLDKYPEHQQAQQLLSQLETL